MKKAKYIIAGLILTIILLGVVQVTVSNSISTGGIQLGTIQAKIADLDRVNEGLHEEYLQLSSYTHIASEAGQLGFVPSSKDLSVSVPTSYAMKP